ncbi:IS200/IS605 family transposase [Pleurocapsa sp. PCC 7319]|uniref:IS200/IS605 family transposase n=1 Tax=Pleurocapsa sp. PCC 7319 TaxID=118161 RepID=UPI000344B72B|nr:IS200/IS605 family transposase [Pleurocapsa sp. PCC 7319]
MVQYKSNNNIVYNCKYHVVWVVKYRRPVLTTEIEARFKEILKNIAAEIQVEILEMEVGDLNHVHLLLSLDPQFGVHKAVRRFKGVSSRYLRKEFPQLKSRLPTLWTNSYFVSTVGGAPLAKIKEYIANQKRSR